MTTPSDVLLALAERCEREEPSRELDAAIALACGWETRPDAWAMPYWRMVGQSTWWAREPSRYTTSLDAAVTLAPEYWVVVDLCQMGNVIRATLWSSESDSYDTHAVGEAKTEPMARCAAALRARASEGVEERPPSAESASTPPPSKDPNT